jgi:hypothetical protein
MNEESIKNLVEIMGKHKSLYDQLISFDSIMEYEEISIENRYNVYNIVSTQLRDQGKQATKVYNNFIQCCRLQNIKFNDFVL